MVPTGTRLGIYEILGSLGQGGMGEVYCARDTRLDRDVALKILPHSFSSDPDRLMRFEREAKTLASLNHPHIAQIYGFEQAGQQSALVMELVDGEDLAQRIARAALPLDEALPIARQIAEALEAAHDAGIIHRDLKPANIKVRPDGTVKVLDFGLAKSGALGALGAPGALGAGATGAAGATVTSPAVTMQGVILGTAAYMAPEQAKGKPVDKRADIWAFGCVLYEMLTGRRAFEGEDVTDTIAAVVTKEPDWSRLPGSTPEAVARLLRRCLEKQVAKRLPHIGVVRLDLSDPSTGETVVPAAPARARRRVVGLIAAALAGAAVTALAAWLVRPAPATGLLTNAPLQFAVPGLDPASASNGVLLSPDGRYLVTRGSAAVSVLHAFDGSPSRALEGTGLCWSPDSSSLVLGRSNQDLVRLDVRGGPPVPFAKTSGAACDWNADGVLLLTSSGSLSSVTISDGAVAPLALDDGGAQTIRVGPRFLPNGRQFLYWAVSSDGQRTVRAGSLDSRESRIIVASDAPAVYSAGHLLFQRGATLVAQPFDEQTLTLSGEPRAITKEAAPGGVIGYSRFDVSEMGMLAFATTNGGQRAQVNWVDRHGQGTRTLTLPEDTELLNPEVSPDGTRVAGVRMDPATGNWDIWIMNVESGEATRVTRQPGIDSDPMWSPDGAELAYVSRRADVQGIFRMTLTDGREQLLMKLGPVIGGVTDVRPTGWSGDGRFVLVQSASADTGRDMVAVPAGGGEPFPVLATPGFEVNGRISPDGRWIAYQSNDSGEHHIYVRPFLRPGAPTRVSVIPGALPQWRGDGRELFWEAPAPEDRAAKILYAAELTVGETGVGGGPPRRVFPPDVRFVTLVDNRRQWAAAPDGHHFVLRQANGPPGPAVKVILNWPTLLGQQ
jgi:dipeptidyl aminopeptidase/acylaminoacyl peptidase